MTEKKEKRAARPILKDLPMTHDEIAAELGISRTRVMQLERAGLAKLKKSKLRFWASSTSEARDSRLLPSLEPQAGSAWQSPLATGGWFYKSH